MTTISSPNHHLHRSITPLSNRASNIFVTLVDRNYIYQTCNKAYCQAHNKTSSEIIGFTVAELWGNQSFKNSIQSNFDRCFTGQEIDEFIWLNFASLGWRYAHVTYIPARDANGEITHCIVVTLDITEQNRVESEIQLLAKFPSENPNPVLRIASEGAIIYANAASQDLLAYWGCKVDELLPSDIRNIVIECRESGQPQAIEMAINERIFVFTLLPVVDAGYVNLYGRDISAQIQAERRYRVLFDNAPNAIVVVDKEGIIQQVNNQTLKMFGYNRDELINTPVECLIPQMLRERHISLRNSFYNSPYERVSDLGMELTAQHKNGTILSVEISLSAMDTPDGQLATAIIRDISARKLAESEVIKLSLVAKETADAVVITDSDGIIQYVNPSFEIMSGYSSAEAIGHTPRIIKSGQHTSSFFETLWNTILAGENYRATIINRRKNGELFHVDQSINPIRDEHGNITHFVSTAKDITERIKAEEEIRRSNTELAHAYDITLEGWARALELRDQETIGHTRRVTELTDRLARKMGIPDSDLIHVRRGALLHDIGKMGIPDRILHKPGELTSEEWEIMRTHPVLANDMLSPIHFLHPALDIPYHHHEKWDGSGYPCGLKGEEIPLVARIFAIIDVYDALTTDRPYRIAWSQETTLAYIREQNGIHFDPQVVEIFLSFWQ